MMITKHDDEIFFILNPKQTIIDSLSFFFETKEERRESHSSHINTVTHTQSTTQSHIFKAVDTLLFSILRQNNSSS